MLEFLPQILILFAFILALEESGYLPRAAFLLDRVMFASGLTGRSFIPLLSSYACAIPGIMATRSIQDPRDRLATIMVAPLTTCSARLPVYTLLIGAFIPEQDVLGWFNLQGLVLFGLYVFGIVSVFAVALGHEALQHDPIRPCAAARTAFIPSAQPARSGHRLMGPRPYFPASRRRHHPDADRAAVVPVELPRRRPPMPCCLPSSTVSPDGSDTSWRRCSRRSDSTGRSCWP